MTRQLFDETEKLLLMGTWSWSPVSNVLEWTDGIYAILEYDRTEVTDRRAHRRITPTIRPFRSTRRIGSLMMSLTS